MAAMLVGTAEMIPEAAPVTAPKGTLAYLANPLNAFHREMEIVAVNLPAAKATPANLVEIPPDNGPSDNGPSSDNSQTGSSDQSNNSDTSNDPGKGDDSQWDPAWDDPNNPDTLNWTDSSRAKRDQWPSGGI